MKFVPVSYSAIVLLACFAGQCTAGIAIPGVVSTFGVNTGCKPQLESEGQVTFVANSDSASATSNPGVAASFFASGLIDQLRTGDLAAGTYNLFRFTVGANIDAFVSSILFEDKVVGLRLFTHGGSGLRGFVLGIDNQELSFAGFWPQSNGFELEIYTEHQLSPGPVNATPEPSAMVIWGCLVATGLIVQPVRRYLWS